MSGRQFAPLYEWRARWAFTHALSRKFHDERESNPERVRERLDVLRLPARIRSDIDVWLNGGPLRSRPVEEGDDITIRVRLNSYAASPDGRHMPSQQAVPERPTRQQYRISDNLRSTAGEVEVAPGRFGWAEHWEHTNEVEIEAANLSAAKTAVVEAVEFLWKERDWSLGDHPYPNAERDAMMLFAQWIEGKTVDKIAGQYGFDDVGRVKAGIRKAKKLLGCKGRPPKPRR